MGRTSSSPTYLVNRAENQKLGCVSEDFARTIIELHGEVGVAWLSRLPALLADCQQRWALTLGPPFVPLSYNYVAPAVRADGTKAVLKAGVPNLERLSEAEALRFYDGRGAVRLLDADPEQGVLLMERLEPGTLLSALPDDTAATSIAASVMRQLWRPAPPESRFPSVADWAAGLKKLRVHFGGAAGPFPTALVEEAESLFAELLASMAEPVLLHGDLHHFNILAAGHQSWRAIDPKGVIGEPAYEVGAFLRNPMPQIVTLPQPGHILTRRVDQFAEELGMDRARLRGWGLAQAVLSAWWSLEDHGYGWEPAMTCAELLAEI